MPRSFSTSHGRRSDPKLFNVPNDLQPNTFSGEGDERPRTSAHALMSMQPARTTKVFGDLSPLVTGTGADSTHKISVMEISPSP